MDKSNGFRNEDDLAVMNSLNEEQKEKE